MRVTLDTNVLISIFVFKSKGLEKILNFICENHKLVLSSYVIDELSYVIDELSYVIAEKFESKLSALDTFLSKISFEVEYTPHVLPHHNLFSIRDKDDEKVLYSAIVADVDVLITGDKDFFDIVIEKPEILTPAQFILEYM